MSLYILLLAYVLSLVLEGLWRLLCAHWFTALFDEPGAQRARDGAIEDFVLVERSFNPLEYRFPGIPVIYDTIRLIEPAAGARLVKLRAELQLCRTLILGWSIVLVAIVLDLAFRASGEVLIVGIWVLPLIVAATIGEYKNLQMRTCWSIYNHWLVLVSPGIGTVAEMKSRAQNS